MQKKFFLIVCLVLGAAIISFSQPGGGGFQMPSVEQRVEVIHKKLDSAFQIPATKLSVLDSALTILFKAQDARMQELFTAGNMDRETMMAERKKYTDARDEMIKVMLSEEQFTIWMEKIAPSLRGGGGRGGFNRQNQQ